MELEIVEMEENLFFSIGVVVECFGGFCDFMFLEFKEFVVGSSSFCEKGIEEVMLGVELNDNIVLVVLEKMSLLVDF